MTSRVEYQKHWALCEILNRHGRGDDYCFVFEFHDDVVILDNAEDPTRAEFCQVKTRTAKKGQWTVKRLIAIEPAEDGEETDTSILGKLYLNRQNFPEETAALTVVSNARFNLELRDDADPELATIQMSMLSDPAKEEILTHLRAKFGDALTHADLESFQFQECSLSLSDASRHSMGVLQDFFERRLPGRRLSLAAIHRTLLSEITNCTAGENSPATFADLRTKQSLSRDEIERHLLGVSGGADPEEEFTYIKARLGDAGWSWRELMRLKAAWRDYMVQRMDPDHPLAQSAREWITPIVRQVLTDHPDIDPAQLMVEVGARLSGASGRPRDLQPHYRNAVILFEAMEIHGEPQVPPSDSPPAEEAA